MIKITNIRILDNTRIHFTFNDNKKKTVDFAPFIKEDKLSSALKDTDFFAQVKVYENGRGIYWPNDFDFCPDFLYQYQADKKAELIKKN
ncbi:MAG: DUF2442 domain-containing protein [Cyclobacteriaceae bacterium]